jgi:hypothetical protein
MSNSHRSALVIKAHLPIDQAGRRYRSDCKKFRRKNRMAAVEEQLTSPSIWTSKKKQTFEASIKHVQHRQRRII